MIKRYSLDYTEDDKNYVKKHVSNILDLGYLTDGGQYVKDFEKEWSKIIGSKYSIAVNSCTTALELILKTINIKDHSVVVPTYTFFATPLSVHNAGGSVIYADVSSDTLSLSLDSIKRRVRADTKAVIIVHVGGVVTNEICEIRNWCDENNIYLIEDAACSHGAKYRDTYSGNFGHFAAFSFHHSKVLTTGEGGMVTTNNKEAFERIKRMRAIGLDRTINNWEVFEIGNNYKLPEISAVLGLLHCNKSKEIFSERRSIAKFYDENINFNKKLRPFKIPLDTTSAYYKYIVLCEDRKFKHYLTKELKDKFDIELPPTTYDYLCHEQAINKHMVVDCDTSFDNARYLMEHNCCLPMYCGLEEEKLKYITDSINSII